MLSLVGVSKQYGSQNVLRDVDWSVMAGERVGLAGANGAGKSTLLRVVAGLVEPDRGEICFRKGAAVGYLPQEIIGTTVSSLGLISLLIWWGISALHGRRNPHALDRFPTGKATASG